MDITIGIVDDHHIVRHGLKELLSKMGQYRVVCEFGSGVEFLDALPLSKKPDVIILDYSMPGMTGLEVLAALSESEEEYRFLLLTQHFDESVIDDAYRLGARGFLHKNCTSSDLGYALNNIVTVGYNNVTEILKRIRQPKSNPTAMRKITLSPRESHFLELVCHEAEYTYEQMAAIMGVSVKSIEAYRSSLFETYNIKSKVGLVLFSHKYQLTPPFL